MNKRWWKPQGGRLCYYPYYGIFVAKPPRRVKLPSLGLLCNADIDMSKAEVCPKQLTNWDRQTNEEHRQGQENDRWSSQIHAMPHPRGNWTLKFRQCWSERKLVPSRELWQLWLWEKLSYDISLDLTEAKPSESMRQGGVKQDNLRKKRLKHSQNKKLNNKQRVTEQEGSCGLCRGL